MKANVTIPLSNLNLDTRQYLQTIWRQRGAAHPGIFVNAFGFGWSAVGAVAGVVMLLGAISGLQPRSLYTSLGTQCLLTSLSFVCLWFAGCAVRRRYSANALGRFGYFDGTWYWDVGRHQLRVTDLSQISGLQWTEHFTNGVRTRTVAHVTLPYGQAATFSFVNRETAQSFARFLQICQDIRRQAALGQLPANVRQFVAEPGGLAQMARKAMDSGGGHLSLEHQAVIHIPNPAALREGRPDFGEWAWPWVFGGSVFVMGWLAFPSLRYVIDHRHHYGMVQKSTARDTAAPRAYLDKFPEGRYHEEVTALLDDRLFALAVEGAERHHSPAAVRNYLAGQPHQRHEDAARQIIARFYDEAIARVRELAANQSTEQQLLAGILAILEHLKTEPTPRVLVAFEPRWSVEPDDSLRMTELKYQAAIARQDDVIERMVQNKGSAIIGSGETFSEKHLRRRESIILRRLSAAVAKILSSDIIAFQESPRPERGDVTVRYEIKPLGSLIKYLRLPDERAPPDAFLSAPRTRTTNTLGLLREYSIHWQLAIQPSQQGQIFRYELNSISGTNLVYRREPGDPEWGAYAVLMYSAFHDFSNRLIAGVGLTPPPAPTTFTFHDAAVRGW